MDEKTGYKMVHVKITESAPNLYQGYIIQAFNPPNHPNQDLSALKGFYLLHDLKQDPNDPYKLISGYIINPFVKKSKKVSIHGKLIKYGNTMILRNSSDPDQSSRSVTWVRKK
ncbi:hypothetical protein AZH43_07765 [Acinetobacter pragensis]|uniref:DUF2147 domain-containing protein n=2 Tax=Acinetobacter pragensis TaxID=1806892 RepID=A0A151Y3Y3_9GAMM|nr:hypothetical protein AZH43_07765 [Acinetobacter pragensis]